MNDNLVHTLERILKVRKCGLVTSASQLTCITKVFYERLQHRRNFYATTATSYIKGKIKITSCPKH